MKQPNFTLCAIEFLNNTAQYENYTYHGQIETFFSTFNASSPPALISLAGCKQLCGDGSDYYDWSQVSATISTWGMPLIGLILQAPFDSNEFRKTMLALARWVGSPIVALSYIFWNIRVTGKCAVMVDMATAWGSKYIPENPEDKENEYAQIRDSFYILSVMNQFSFKNALPDSKAGERLLRVALFSDTRAEMRDVNLAEKRKELAENLRDLRKKGVVPVFISLGWFIFSLIVSIQAAWGQLGTNSTAHNLALGLLTAWLPVLILCCIVDRNPAAAEAVEKLLKAHVALTRRTLLARQDRQRHPDMDWVNILVSNTDQWDTLFNRFAGQGRIRFHYGVAQPIIHGIERSLDFEDGRDWLKQDGARQALVKGPEKINGLNWFDKKEIWQLFSAFLIVFSAVAGAFIVSFFTPTVGLGCRSGGYMIFFILASAALVLEYACWWVTDKAEWNDDDIPIPTWDLGRWWRSMYRWWNSLIPRNRFEILVLRPIEIVNAIWLLYILVAQTFGSYETCECMAAVWGFNPGYIDFHTYAFYENRAVFDVWAAGTAVSIIVMFISFVYIVWEWCEQSHLCTSDYGKARRGLIRTRNIKHWTLGLHNGPRTWYELGRRGLGLISPHNAPSQARKQSMIWSGPPTKGEVERRTSKQHGASGKGSYDQLSGGESKDPLVTVHEVGSDRDVMPRRRTEERLLRRDADEERGYGFGLEQIRSPDITHASYPTHTTQTPDHLGLAGIERYYSGGGDDPINDYFPRFREQ